MPSSACLPNFLLVPSSTRALAKSLSRLSRATLIDIALEWLQDKNQSSCEPYLTRNRETQEREEEDYAYLPADNIEELRYTYMQLKENGGTKRDVIDRILDGDWRRGLSLRQLAIVDGCFLQEHDSALRWTALKLIPIDSTLQKETGQLPVSGPIKMAKSASISSKQAYPSLHASTFLQNLQREIAPVVKAHYYLYRNSSRSLTMLRLYVTDSPYTSSITARKMGLADSSRTLFVAFPDSCPFIYVSITGPCWSGKSLERRSTISAYDIMSLKKAVLEAVPKAMSRPHYRYGLESTSLSVKSLSTMMSLRGPGRHGASNGAYSIFAEGSVDESPLNLSSRKPSSAKQSESVMRESMSNGRRTSTGSEVIAGSKRKEPLAERDVNLPTLDPDGRKKRKIAAARRFGTIDTSQPGCKGVDRCQITFADPLVGALQSTKDPRTATDEPRDGDGSRAGRINVVFHGSDIFGGIRRLVEAGLIREEKMPAWMTGEMGVSSGVAWNGKILKNKGGGA